MRLASPWGLAALGLLVPLVVWYLLKSRRTRRVVSSTMVWQSVPQAMTAATPWQRFRPDATFWLAAFALVVGAVALARPYAVVEATLGDHTIVIVDASGSMSAREGDTTRLEQARRDVATVVDGIGDGQEVSVIEAGSQARVLVAGATTADEVDGALARLRLQDGPADLDDAFVLATALQRPDQATVMHVVTDREVPGALVADRAVSIQPVGAVRDNLAVTRLQVVPRGSGTADLFVALRNWAQHPVEARLSITVDGEEVAAEVVDLAPRDAVDRTLNVRGGAGAVVRATLVPADDTVDVLALDDSAWGVLRSPEQVRVVAATPGNVFLTAALEAVDGVEVTEVAAVPDDLSGADLLVVDRVAVPAGVTVPMLLVAPTSWPAGVTAAAPVDLPALTIQTDHELLGSVDLSAVAVAAATPLSGDQMTPVAGGTDGDLVVAGRLAGVPTVALGFSLTDSNLPLTAAWPTFVANAVGWLAGAPPTVPAVAGGTVVVDVPAGLDTVLVSPPDGRTVEVSAVAPTLVVDRVGLWRVVPGAAAPGSATDTPAGVAELPSLVVNPDGDEGDLAQPPPEPVAVVTAGDGPELAPGRQPLASLVVPVVLVALLLEWVRATVVARRRAGGRGDRPGGASRAERGRDGRWTSSVARAVARVRP